MPPIPFGDGQPIPIEILEEIRVHMKRENSISMAKIRLAYSRQYSHDSWSNNF